MSSHNPLTGLAVIIIANLALAVMAIAFFGGK